MNTFFIVNPTAGRGRSLAIWNSLIKHISFPFEAVTTEAPGDATFKARGAVDRGYTKIVSVGGDGTLHEVVNGIIGADVELGVIPAGTGNDFVRTLGIPNNPRAALEYIEKGRADYIDLGKHNGGYYINSAGAGLDAEVVRAANDDIGFFKGTWAYICSVLKTLAGFSPWEATITVDGDILKRKVWLVAVGNGKYIGGGMMMCPDASMGNGLLEVCIVNEMSRLEILRFLPKIFSGGHKDHPAFEVVRGRDIRIESRALVPVHVDGEMAGRVPVNFSVAPRAIKVIRYK